MNESGKFAKNSYKAGTIQYGTTKKYSGRNAQYPEIYAQEKYSGVNISDVTDGTQIILGEIDETALGKMNPKGKNKVKMYIWIQRQILTKHMQQV